MPSITQVTSPKVPISLNNSIEKITKNMTEGIGSGPKVINTSTNAALANNNKEF
jgi:hypothetical protein